MNIFDHIKNLNNLCLYGDVRQLASIALSLCESQPDLMSPFAKYQTLVYLGDAVYMDKEYKRAEVIYKKALQIRKWINKSKGKSLDRADVTVTPDAESSEGAVLTPKQTTTPPGSPESQVTPSNTTAASAAASAIVKKCPRAPKIIKKAAKKTMERPRRKKEDEPMSTEVTKADVENEPGEETKSFSTVTQDTTKSAVVEDQKETQDVCSEAELKYKLHQCYVNTKQPREAITVLEGISAKLRNAKINMALAQLYHRMGMDRSAVTAYKGVLRECPMSLEAAQGLLTFGVKGTEVGGLVMTGGTTNAGPVDWLSLWIKAHSYSSNKEYVSAVNSFKQLDVKPVLKDNIEVLCTLADVQYHSGDYTHALETLKRVHALDPLLLHKMDTMAFLFYKENNKKELENLSCELMQVSDTAPEPWVAMGYYCMETKKPTKAVYFAQKAYTLDGWNIEALLLKGFALLELKKTQDALPHFREALRIGQYTYEAHKGLVDCYLCSHRTREAITFATQACKQLGQNARSLTLYASVLAQEPLSLDKAKSILEKAMKQEPGYLESVYIMCEILWQQQQYEKGIEILRRTLQHNSTSRLHQMLADFLCHTAEHQEALDQYSIAISLDSTNQKAKEGLERIEKQGDMGMDTTYDIEVDDINESDNDGELEGSDIESAWSDIDLN